MWIRAVPQRGADRRRPACDGHGWLRGPRRWSGRRSHARPAVGSRTLDVDLIACYDDGDEVLSRDDG
ncbi:putative 2-amino-4-hydroxy-6-hydroxymethyldihydropteridine pyrophosphokinase [Mycobacterium xenopi 3993]|nr:putative 2-amino-4-hydroxy-6-hydroxymethyldihydropteridine pyrophosphokinase [Mycobacterium xenopi 3993]